MTSLFTRAQPALALAAANPDGDLRLAVLAAHAGLSVFHLHRVLSAVTGETPKEYTLRLRVGHGAALLLTTGQSVLDIALSCGFNSHEAFTRAFQRQFDTTPRAYRARGFATTVTPAEAASHARLVREIGPCIGLFHVRTNGRLEDNHMAYEIEKKELAAQPVLVARRRVKRSEIATAITEVLPHVFQYAQQHGIALSGHPFTRYKEMGAGLITIEPGIRVAGPLPAEAAASRQVAATGGVVEDVLPAGPAAVTTHMGPYDTLSEAYAAIETWMEAEGQAAAGAPWESYITDPAEHPDPKDWKTEVAWPLK
jgi:AraC family transcriptional regulator